MKIDDRFLSIAMQSCDLSIGHRLSDNNRYQLTNFYRLNSIHRLDSDDRFSSIAYTGNSPSSLRHVILHPGFTCKRLLFYTLWRWVTIDLIPYSWSILKPGFYMVETDRMDRERSQITGADDGFRMIETSRRNHRTIQKLGFHIIENGRKSCFSIVFDPFRSFSNK